MKQITNIYLFLLACIVGIELCMGILVAPIIFRPSEFIGPNVLSHFQSGQLMTQVFLSYNKILLFVSVVAFVYEIINLIKNKNESFRARISAFMLSVIILGLSLLFVFYFTAYIISAQALGAEVTASSEFKSVHGASEITMKIMLLAQVALFFVRAKR